MYSPKIADDLIPLLYREAKDKGVPMTRLVDAMIRQALNLGIRTKPTSRRKSESSRTGISQRPTEAPLYQRSRH